MATSKIGGGLVKGTLSGFTSDTIDNGCSIWKRNNVVTIAMNIKSVSGANANLASCVPEGFRPQAQTCFIAGDGSVSGQSVGNVNFDGQLNIWFGSSKYCQGFLTYVI